MTDVVWVCGSLLAWVNHRELFHTLTKTAYYFCNLYRWHSCKRTFFIQSPPWPVFGRLAELLSGCVTDMLVYINGIYFPKRLYKFDYIPNFLMFQGPYWLQSPGHMSRIASLSGYQIGSSFNLHYQDLDIEEWIACSLFFISANFWRNVIVQLFKG